MLGGVLVSLVLLVSQIWSLRDGVSLLAHTSWSGWKALLALFPVVNCGYIQTECKRWIVLRSVRGKGAIASFSLIKIPFILWNLRKGFLPFLPEIIPLQVMGKKRGPEKRTRRRI